MNLILQLIWKLNLGMFSLWREELQTIAESERKEIFLLHLLNIEG